MSINKYFKVVIVIFKITIIHMCLFIFLEMEKQYKEEMQSKDNDIKELILKEQQLKMKLKEMLKNEKQRIHELQTAFASYIKSAKQAAREDIAEVEEY